MKTLSWNLGVEFLENGTMIFKYVFKKEGDWMEILLRVAIAMIIGALMIRVTSRFKLPDVTCYLLAGVLIGPTLLGHFKLGFPSYEDIEKYSLISSVSLGFIAFSIGNEFRLKVLRRTGRQAFIIGVFQAVVATALVDLALVGLHFVMPDKLSISSAITLGAIASATAPAATLMVVKQYQAKGNLTSLLLPIVALDDAVGLIIFAVSFGIAKAMAVGQSSLISILVNPLIEIVGSLILGALAGIGLTRLVAVFDKRDPKVAITIAFVFLMVGCSMAEFEFGELEVGFSSLLVCMMMATVFCNVSAESFEVMEEVGGWTNPILVLFFVISGAELELEVFTQISVIIIGIVYILFRCAGKYLGSFGSALVSGCDQNVVKYLGITLFPQAGVALGMCVTARSLPEGNLIRNIVLFAVLVYELVGPLMTKWALTQAGDIKEN